MNNSELVALGREAVDILMHSDDELYHWGIKGMKWGVRRYQNPDGSLTAAGKKRRAALKKELEILDGPKKQKELSEMTLTELNKYIARKSAEENARLITKRVDEMIESQKQRTPEEIEEEARAQKKAERDAKRDLKKAARKEARAQRRAERKQKKLMEKNTGDTSKKIENMSDAELAAYVARKTAEKNAYGLRNDISKLNPKHQSAGKQMVDELKKSLGPVVADAGKKFLTTAMNQAVRKALGDDGVDAMAALKKEADKAGFDSAMSKARQEAAKAVQEEYRAKNAKWDWEHKTNPDKQNKQQNKEPSVSKADVEKLIADALRKNTDQSNAEVQKRAQKIAEDNFDNEWDFYYQYLEDEYWKGRDN